MNRFWLLITLPLFSLASALDGQILDNGAPNRRDGYEMTHWVQADDFMLATSARIDSIKLWTLEGSGAFQGSILWQIYSNADANVPGAVLFSGTTTSVSHAATGFVLYGYPEYETTVNIGPVVLPAGVYWISLHNGPLSNNSDQGRMFWETTNNVGGSPSQSLLAPFTGLWSSHAVVPGAASDFAFQLFGVLAPRIASFTVNNSPVITFNSTAGQTYRVQYKESITDVSWAYTSGSEIPGTGGTIQGNDPDPLVNMDTRRSYRVRLCPCTIVPGPKLTGFDFVTAPRISFTTVAGQSYRVEYKTDPSQPSWTALPGAELIAGNGGTIQVSDNDPLRGTASRRFYRATLLQD